MRYDEYQNKVKKAAGVKKFLYRFRFLFISVISVIAVIGIVLFNTKGLITSSTPISQMEYHYGQDIQYDISGFMTSKDDVGLEFQVDGEWTTEAPNKPGNYPVRPYSTNNYGGRIYGNTQTISISPKPVTLNIKSKSIDYGEKPEITILDEEGKDGLVKGDTLTYSVKYENLSSSDTPNCYVDLADVKVEDPKGRDVTECYSFMTPASPVRINKRTLVFNPAKTSLIYDGKTHDTSSDIERIKEGKFDNETSLVDGDRVESFPSPCQFSDAKSQSYTYDGKDFKIVNSDGVDVTRHYALTIGNGEFDIKPAELIITSGSVSKVYDGEPIEVPDPKVDETTPLQGNDVLKIVNHSVSPFYRVGSIDNEFEFDIVDKDNPEISHIGNYHITVNTGKLTITKAPAVHVNVSKTDEFVNKYVSDFEVRNENLVDYLTFHTSDLKGNDKLKYDKTKKNYAREDTPAYTYDVESNTYKLEQPSLHIFHEDGEDVTDCYESVSFSDGHQNITDVKKKKIEINLNLPQKEYEYKGAPIFQPNDLQKVVIGNDDGLNVVLVEDSYTIPTDYQEEAYVINPKFRLMNGSKDVTDYYDLEVHPLEVKVKQKNLWIDIEENGGSLSKIYDGSEIVPVFTVTGLVSNDVDGVHHYAQVTFKDSEYGFDDIQADGGTTDRFSLHLNIKDAGTYAFKDMNDEEADAYLKRLLEWHIYDSIGISAKDVTSNYKVTLNYEDKTISIEKKHIEIKFENMIHFYDGKPFSGQELADNYTIVGGNTLAAGHTLRVDLDGDYKNIGTYSDFQNHISKIEVYDGSGAIVTDNYDIDYRSNAFSLTIKKTKIVYTLGGSNSIYTDPETHIQSVAYGSVADQMVYGNGSINFASSSDFELYGGNKNELETHYHLDTGYKLKAKNPDDNTLDGVYKLTMEEFNLKPDPTYENYGYGVIDASMIDFTMDGLDGNQLKIHRRQLNLQANKTDLKFLFNGVDGIDKDEFGFLKQYLSWTPNLAFNDTLSISWKPEYQDGLKIDGDYAEFNDKRFENIQDMIDIRIFNKDGKDVTNYYSRDRDGKDGYDNNVSGKELKINETISVTYEKPRVSLSLDGVEDKKTIQAYDSTKNPSKLFKASLDNVLDDGKQPPEIGIKVSQPENYNTNRVGEYRFHVDEVSLTWNGFDFSWRNGSIVCEGKKDFTLYVNRLKLSITRPSEEQVYWQDGKELTLEEEPSSGEKDPGKAYLYDRYASYFNGLHSGDTIHFERIPGSSLPKEASIDAYSLLENYRITVRHPDPNNSNGFEDVTDNYDIDISENEESEKVIHLEDYLWKFDESTLSYRRTEEPFFERFYIYRFAGSLSYEFVGDDGNKKTDFFKTDMPITSGRYNCSFTSDMPDSIQVDPNAFRLVFDPCDETTFGPKYTKVKKVTYDVSGLYGTYLNDDSILEWEDGGTDNSIDLTIQNSYFNVIHTPVTIDVSNVRLTTLHEDVSKKPSEIQLMVKDVVSIDGQLNKNNIIVQLNDTVELSADKENIITGDDVVVSIAGGYEDISDYNIKVNDFKLTYEKPTLKITMNKGDWCEYDGKSDHHPGYSVKLYDSKGNELSKKDGYNTSLENVEYNKYVTDAGSYTGFEITDFTVKVNQTTYSKDDFNVQYLNQNDAVFEVRRRKLTVTDMKSCKVGEEYSGLSTSEIARRLKEEIKKNPNNYFNYSKLISGHSLSDFDVDVVIINNAYYYTITPTKIVDTSGNDVTYCYEISTSFKAPLIIQMPASDDDFE